MELNKVATSVDVTSTITSEGCLDAILVCPGMYPQEICIGHTIEDFQELLDGDLEFIPTRSMIRQ